MKSSFRLVHHKTADPKNLTPRDQISSPAGAGWEQPSPPSKQSVVRRAYFFRPAQNFARRTTPFAMISSEVA